VRGEVYNVCSGRGVSIAEVITMFEAIAGIRPVVYQDPARMRPVENASVIGSNEKIANALGWKPAYTLEESLRAVYEYWFNK
jgi:GDP-4-dehydro-6-deoxy-D-mannose reductase